MDGTPGKDGAPRSYYVRQLWDGKGSADLDEIEEDALEASRRRLRMDPCPRSRAHRRPLRHCRIPRQRRRLRSRTRALREILRRPERMRLPSVPRISSLTRPMTPVCNATRQTGVIAAYEQGAAHARRASFIRPGRTGFSCPFPSWARPTKEGLQPGTCQATPLRPETPRPCRPWSPCDLLWRRTPARPGCCW